ncbi:MAG: AAA family ATPase, partial [Thaumarchaeota archaeon]|nr:AAA family ATPase [Nitrososphaerota archaeon]
MLELETKNYKTLEQINLKFAPDYCTLSGRNNAGKSAVIRALNILLTEEARPWLNESNRIDYSEDRTQWIKAGLSIEIKCKLCLTRADDPALIQFIEKITNRSLPDKESVCEIQLTVSPKNEAATVIRFNDSGVSDQDAREIVRKLKSSNVLFIHNSTADNNEFVFGRGRAQAYYEVQLSGDEQKQISEAGKMVRRKIKMMAKEHRDELNKMLGKLTEKYDVQFDSLDFYTAAREMPLGINLSDKQVEVPLNSWGSGTQNRTYVLMSILKANRIKTRQLQDDKIIPIVLIEEPESFLHPSAQAEFGKMLQALSVELGIQIIVSTHSPFMLNQVEPRSNILLRRRMVRHKLKETQVIDTSGEHWMEPFAEHLGISSSEFPVWRHLFSAHKNRVLLVEGQTDKEYFEYLIAQFATKFAIPSDTEITSYGGKDTIKNTALLKFTLSKFEKSYITFDLDAKGDLKNALGQLGLKEVTNYLALGVDKPGRDAVEGLLPDRI